MWCLKDIIYESLIIQRRTGSFTPAFHLWRCIFYADFKRSAGSQIPAAGTVQSTEFMYLWFLHCTVRGLSLIHISRRSWSVSSILRRKSPPSCFAIKYAYSAVLKLPTCIRPVGLGANLVRILSAIFLLISLFLNYHQGRCPY